MGSIDENDESPIQGFIDAFKILFYGITNTTETYSN